ncbi:MAG: AraC family transcriptional regulator, partial [Faecalibacterium prausnitzii]
SLDTVAKALFIDKYNFSHMFKQNMQISFYQYVIQQRLLEAKSSAFLLPMKTTGIYSSAR